MGLQTEDDGLGDAEDGCESPAETEQEASAVCGGAMRDGKHDSTETAHSHRIRIISHKPLSFMSSHIELQFCTLPTLPLSCSSKFLHQKMTTMVVLIC